MRNIKAIDIARKLGVHSSAIYHEIRGKHSSRRLREAIADAVGIPYDKLWGNPITTASLPKFRRAVNG